MNRNHLFTVGILVCAASVLGALPLKADDAAPSPAADTIAVIASGTGKDEDAALKQAFSNAIEEAIGTIVDSETVIKNDQIITDQVLTAYNAIVTHYDPIGAPQAKDGLVTVKINAVIEKKQLTDRLAAANVVSRQVSGSDLFAQMTTDLQREKDAVAIVHRVFQDFPGNVLAAESVGEPRIISKTEEDAEIGVNIHFSIDTNKYAQWQKAAVPLLSKVARQVEEVRWNPQAEGAKELDTVDSSFLPGKKNPIQIGPEDSHQSLLLYWISGRSSFPWAKTDGPILAIFEKRGSTRVLVLHWDEENKELANEVLRATFALPVVEITLHDSQGNEIDGQQTIAVFEDRKGGKSFQISATPFRGIPEPGTTDGMLSNILYADAISPDYLANLRFNVNGGNRPPRCAIVPYFGNNEGCIAVAGFTREFDFKLTPDQLKNLKSVTANISSHAPKFKSD